MQKRLKDKPDFNDVVEEIKSLEKQLTGIEEALHQTKAKSSQDVLNFPIRLNNKLVTVAGGVADGDFRPTDSALQVKDELVGQVDAELTKLHTLMESDLARFNAMLAQKRCPASSASRRRRRRSKGWHALRRCEGRGDRSTPSQSLRACRPIVYGFSSTTFKQKLIMSR